MADFFTEIRERRVLPAVGVYAAGCWVLIEILDRLVERYLLSPYLTDIFFWGLYSLIPAVILVAWSYGRPGKDKATTAQKVGVPINIIATAGLLITIFGGKDLGAAANLVTVANEQGQTETHYIPSDNYRRRLAVFFFDNQSGDPELDWLQYGMTNLLVQDLQQDVFVAATDPWANWGNGLYARMQRAGFADGLDVPRSLLREIADDANRQHFVDGEIQREGDEYVVTARAWNTQTLELAGEITARGWDIHAIADELTDGIKEALEVPVAGKASQNLPLSETFGESEEAFRSYIQALNTRLFDNDIPGAIALFDKTLEADPNFVLGWFMKGLVIFEGGDLPTAQAAFQKARELDYRLPEMDRTILKMIDYYLAGETDKVIALLKLSIQLHDDAASHVRLAGIYMATGEMEAAKQEYLAALERDPMNMGIYLNLALLEKGTGNLAGAIDYAQRYQEEKPDDEQAPILLGDLMRDMGDLDGAAENYLQAQLVSDSPVNALLRLSELVSRNGNIAESRKLLEQAEEAAVSPLEMIQVRGAASQLEYRLGRVHSAIDQINAQHEYAEQVMPAMGIAMGIYNPLVRAYLDVGDTQKATEALVAGKSLLQPPMDQFLAFSEAYIHIANNDLAAAQEAIISGVAIVEQFDFDALKFQITALEGEILKEQGSFVEAADLLSLSLDEFQGSLFSTELYAYIPMFYAELAYVQTLAGMLEEAEQTINNGMSIDPNQPLLWLVKARHQFESGMESLAAASVQYALAIWKDADPDYIPFTRAKRLAEEIAASGG